MEDKQIEVYYPPIGSRRELVGYVHVINRLGGCAVEAESTLDNQVLERHVGDKLPFFGWRVERAAQSAVGRLTYDASLILRLPGARDL